MAVLNVGIGSGNGSASYFGQLLKAVSVRIAAFGEYLRVSGELNGLTSRELDDINVAPGDIPSIARRAAREVLNRA